MKFKNLEIKDQEKGIRKYIRSGQFRKSILAVIIGAAAGAIFFYFTEGKSLNEITGGDIIESMLIGAFFGFFIINSPCAGNRC